MKRTALLAHLRRNGCELLREGGSHTIVQHLMTGRKTAVPRHREIPDLLARKICRDLNVPEP